MIEDLGARWLAGEPVDPATFSALSNTERRLYAAAGLRRRPRDVEVPSLEEIVTGLESLGLPVDLIEQEEGEDVSKRD